MVFAKSSTQKSLSHNLFIMIYVPTLKQQGITSDFSERSVINMLESQKTNKYLYSRAVNALHLSPNVKR